MNRLYGPPPWPGGRILHEHPPADRIRPYDAYARPMFGPWRLAMLAGLLVVTLLYIGTMAHNVVPPWPPAVQRDLMACRAVSPTCRVVHVHGSYSVTNR